MRQLNRECCKRVFSYVVCVISCLLICLIAFYRKKYYPYGMNTILSWDGYSMTGPFCYYIWDIMHGEASLFLNWDIAAGANMIGVYNMFSPINILYLFIPRTMVPAAQTWFFVIRVILMAMSFQYFLDSVVKNRTNIFFSVFCSCSYAMSIWTFSFANLPYFLDGAFYLPLICSFVVRLMEENQCKKRYSIMLAASMLSGVQPAYIIVLFIFLFSGVYILTHFKIKERAGVIVRLGSYTLLGIGISAVFFVPMAIGALTSGRLTDNSFVKEFINMLQADGFQEEKRVFLSGMAGVIFLLNGGLFLSRLGGRGKVPQKKNANAAFALSLLMLLSVFVEGIHLVWQGGNYVAFPLRGGYTIYFAIFYCLAESVSVLKIQLQSWTSEHLKISGYNKFLSHIAGYALGICLLIIGVRVAYTNAISFTPQKIMGLSDGLYLQGQNLYQATRNEVLPAHRYKIFDATLEYNYGFIADVPTIGNYIHLVPERALEANRGLGYAQDYTRLSDVGGTVFSDALLGYRYTLSRTRDLNSILYKPIDSAGDVVIYKNQYVFPFGFLVSADYYDEGEELEDKPFENQNRIAQAVLGEEVLEITEYALHSDNIMLKAEYDCAVYIYKKDMDFSGGPNRLRFNVNGEDILCPTYLSLDNPYYATFFNDGILYLGSFEEGEQINITYEVENEGKFQLAICNLELLRERTPEDVVSDMQFALNGLEISVTNPSEEAMLYLPISNIGGWNIKLNDKAVSPRTIFGDYMGIIVPNGVSKIDMTYYPSGFRIGLAITLVSIFAMIFFDKIIGYIEKTSVRLVKVVYILYSLLLLALFAGFLGFVIYTMYVLFQDILLRIHWFLNG